MQNFLIVLMLRINNIVTVDLAQRINKNKN